MKPHRARDTTRSRSLKRAFTSFFWFTVIYLKEFIIVRREIFRNDSLGK